MNYSPARMTETGASLGFVPSTVERVVRLLDVLQELSDDPVIGPRTGLKGGTALNVFFMDLSRLSVDIDLNYVGSADVEAMKADKRVLEQRIPRLMANLGYSMKRMPSDHAGGKWRFGYRSAFGNPGTLEIDLNYLFRVPFFGTGKLDSIELAGHRATGIQCVDVHEILAGKMTALAGRRASRDLFDAWRAIGMRGVDWTKVKAGMLAIGAAQRSFDWREGKILGLEVDQQELRQKLGTCVRTDLFAAYGGPEKWAAQAAEEVRTHFEGLFTFNDREIAFLDAIEEEGRIDTSLLDVDDEARQRIAMYPALRWKAQHRADFIAKGSATAKPR